MLGCFNLSSTRPYPSSQLPILQSQRIYPGSSRGGYFSLSNHPAMQPNMAATVTNARLDETDIYMSRYELSVKMCLADRYKSSAGNLQRSAGQEHRSLLDEENDRSRQIRLVVSSVVGSANLDDRAITEETLSEKVYNQMLGKTKYPDQISQTSPKVEYVDRRDQKIVEPPKSSGSSQISSLHDFSVGIKRTDGNSIGVIYSEPGLAYQGIFPHSQHQSISSKETIVIQNPADSVSQADLGCKFYCDNNSTERRNHGRSSQLEYTSLANPMREAGSSTQLPREKDTAEKIGWSLSDLLAAPFASNAPSSTGWTSSDLLAASFASNVPSSTGWTSSDLLAAPFASNAPSSTGWTSSNLLAAPFASTSLSSSVPSSRPSPNSTAYNSSETSRSSNPVHSKYGRHEMIETGLEGLFARAISSYLPQNNPVSAKFDNCFSAMEKNEIFEPDLSESSLYDTADESPPRSVNLQQTIDLRLNDLPKPVHRFLPLSNNDFDRTSGGEKSPQFIRFHSSQGGTSFASQEHLDSPMNFYQSANSSNAAGASTHNTSIDELCYRDLFFPEDGTASSVAPAKHGEHGIYKTEIPDGNDYDGYFQNISTSSHGATLNPLGTRIDNLNPAVFLSTSDTIRQYLNSFPQPATLSEVARNDIAFTPAPLYAPTPLGSEGEYLVERLERLALDWVEPTVVEDDQCIMGDWNLGMNTTYNSSSRTPIPLETLTWLRKNLEDITNDGVPDNDCLYPEDNDYYH